MAGESPGSAGSNRVRAGSRARATAFALVAVLALYVAVLAGRAWLLLTSGRFTLVLLGVGVLLLPVVAAVLVVAELRFGFATQRLGSGSRPRRPTGGRPPSRSAGAQLTRSSRSW